MKIWFYVEGQSDVLALRALWSSWINRLRGKGIGLQVISLDNKSQLLKTFGARCAEKLANNTEDVVVALPDLYPIAAYAPTRFSHTDVLTLKTVLEREVHSSLVENHRFSNDRADLALKRVCISALKHDLEMLLLAAKDQLQSVLGARNLGSWTHPVENQNHQRPPKQVVQDLFRKHKKRGYRETIDAIAVLGKVEDIGTLVRNVDGLVECPVFLAMLQWAAQQTRVSPFQETGDGN